MAAAGCRTGMWNMYVLIRCASAAELTSEALTRDKMAKARGIAGPAFYQQRAPAEPPRSL